MAGFGNLALVFGLLVFVKHSTWKTTTPSTSLIAATLATLNMFATDSG